MLKKKWHQVAVSAGGTGTDAGDVKQLFVGVKDALRAAGLHVVASSNGTTVDDDDLVESRSSVVTPDKAGAGPRTWVVFSLDKLGVELCVSFEGSNYARAVFYVSRNMFNGGETGCRPRALDEVEVSRTPNWVTPIGGTGGNYGAVVLWADDGSLRVVVQSHRPGAEVVMLFEKVGDAVFASVYSGPIAAGEVVSDAGVAPGFVIHEVSGREILVTKAGTVNEISGEHMLFPVGVFSRGQKIGYVEDMWAVPSPPARTWDQIGDDMVVVGGNVFPWPNGFNQST